VSKLKAVVEKLEGIVPHHTISSIQHLSRDTQKTNRSGSNIVHLFPFPLLQQAVCIASSTSTVMPFSINYKAPQTVLISLQCGSKMVCYACTAKSSALAAEREENTGAMRAHTHTFNAHEDNHLIARKDMLVPM
jgi:hypothetical protein